MAYIGKEPANSFISFEKQVFTIVNSQTAYTLSHAITNENDIRLVVNNVIQAPGSGKAYTASGTTLTLSAALVNGTDEMYCVYLGRALQTVNAPDGSISNSQVAPTIITGQTALGATPADTDELLISDAGTLKRVDYSYLKSANTPAFHAFLNTTQTISDDTVTTVQFNTESLDTDSAYDTSNYRFTPQVAGKYYVYAAINHNPSSSTNVQQAGILIRKNGSGITENFFSCGTNQIDSVVVVGSIIVDLNGSSDYVDVAGSQAISSGTNRFTGDSTQSRTYFGAYKIIGA
jgi:hypothetical protein